MDKGYERFFQRNPMPEEQAGKLFAHMRLKHFRTGEYITRQGNFNSDFYVIDKGIWSATEQTVDTPDITLWFAFSGEPVFNVWCYIMDKFSPVNIVSETDSTAWVIDKQSLEQLMQENREISECLWKIILGQLAYYENRLLEMSRPANASKKYLWISKWHPELLQEVPLSRIASFLGVTIQSLSRIRHNLLKRN